MVQKVCIRSYYYAMTLPFLFLLWRGTMTMSCTRRRLSTSQSTPSLLLSAEALLLIPSFSPRVRVRVRRRAFACVGLSDTPRQRTAKLPPPHHPHFSSLYASSSSSFFSSDASMISETKTTATSHPIPTSENKEDKFKSQQERSPQPEQQTLTPPPIRRISAPHNVSLSLQTFAAASHELQQNLLAMVLSHLTSRQSGPETIQAAQTLASLTGPRTALIQQRDAYLSERNTATADVQQQLILLQKQRKTQSQHPVEEKASASTSSSSSSDNNIMIDVDDIHRRVEAAKERSVKAAQQAQDMDAQLTQLETRMNDLLLQIPNLLDDVVPEGTSDADNELVRVWGDTNALPKLLQWQDDQNPNNIPTSTLHFTPAEHEDIAFRLGAYPVQAAVAMSGARFVALSGDLARLERAITQFLLDMHTSRTATMPHPYTEVSVPYVVSRSSLVGTSQLPKFYDDLFAISPTSHTCNGEDAFLIPTAEVPVTNLHRDSILDEDDLPLRYVACTPCFRAEAGSYGRDTKGLIRNHQFLKVELVMITTPELAREQHELLTSHAEACLQALQLPYRKMRLCAGDTGFAARHCYDLEVWLPGAQQYREISSCSHMGDFQARRLQMRYRPKSSRNKNNNSKNKSKSKSKPVFCHTINGSGLAVGRTLVAILENYQRPDGSVYIPDVLRPYMGGKTLLEPPVSSNKVSRVE